MNTAVITIAVADLGANKSKDIRLNSAYLKARQARFEHGECG